MPTSSDDMIAVEYAILPMPLPGPYSEPCGACQGTGATGNLCEFQSGTPLGSVIILCQELCPECGGCGNAQGGIDGDGNDHCDVRLHHDWEPDWEPDDDVDDEDLAGACPSCYGRGWWTVQAFDDTKVRHLRTPCGCSTPRLIRAGSAAEAAAAAAAATGNRA